MSGAAQRLARQGSTEYRAQDDVRCGPDPLRNACPPLPAAGPLARPASWSPSSRSRCCTTCAAWFDRKTTRGICSRRHGYPSSDALPGLRDARALPAFLYRTARNHALAHLRHRDADFRLYAAVDASQTSTEPEPTFTAEDAAAVHAGLDKLSLPHREALTLFFLQDLSIEEIASVLGIPPGTVKSRLHHAKKALGAVLREGVDHVAREQSSRKPVQPRADQPGAPAAIPRRTRPDRGAAALAAATVCTTSWPGRPRRRASRCGLRRPVRRGTPLDSGP